MSQENCSDNGERNCCVSGSSDAKLGNCWPKDLWPFVLVLNSVHCKWTETVCTHDKLLSSGPNVCSISFDAGQKGRRPAQNTVIVGLNPLPQSIWVKVCKLPCDVFALQLAHESLCTLKADRLSSDLVKGEQGLACPRRLLALRLWPDRHNTGWRRFLLAAMGRGSGRRSVRIEFRCALAKHLLVVNAAQIHAEDMHIHC